MCSVVKTEPDHDEAGPSGIFSIQTEDGQFRRARGAPPACHESRARDTKECDLSTYETLKTESVDISLSISKPLYGGSPHATKPTNGRYGLMYV